jgi:glycosyltransferase involved in cell wall biosynthesis
MQTADVSAPVADVHVLHIVNDLDTGGAQTLLETLAGHRAAHQRLSLCVLGARGKLSDRLEAVFDDVTYLEFPRTSWALGRLVKQVGAAIATAAPDVVHTHLLHADLAVALGRTRLPLVSTVHTTGMSDGDRLRSRVLGRAVGVLARRFDAIVACDPTCAEYLRTMRYPLARTQVIVNGVHLPDTVSPPPASDTPVVLSLSRWHPMKDHDNLFAAAASLLRQGKTFRLVCAGSGVTEDNGELAALAERHGVRSVLEVLGPRNDVAALLAQATAFVLSSAYGEALPMAGLEALAAGRPVVATEVGGCPDLVVDPALLVAPRDPDALAAAVAHVVDASPARWAELSAAARSRAAARYDARRTVAAYDAIYRRLAALPAHGPLQRPLSRRAG